MSRETDIQWCDGSVNPTMGCDGCELWTGDVKRCYAGVLHERYGGTNKGFSPQFNILTEYPGRMAKAAAWSDLTGTNREDKPWLNGLPRTIFVSDMSDALSKAITFDYLKTEIINVVTSDKGRRHVWMWLTKQSPRMAEFSGWLKAADIDWPANLWPGTSITSRATLGRALHLMRVGNADTTRFVSVEPLREGVDLTHVVTGPDTGAGWTYRHWNLLTGNNWCDCNDFITPVGTWPIRLAIVGGESGPGARPFNVQWARDIIGQCKAAGVATFCKQLGAHPVTSYYDREFRDLYDAGGYEWPDPIDWDLRDGQPPLRSQIVLDLKDKKGGDWSEWSEDLKVRQFPQPVALAGERR